jgi:hypothetical protein
VLGRVWGEAVQIDHQHWHPRLAPALGAGRSVLAVGLLLLPSLPVSPAPHLSTIDMSHQTRKRSCHVFTHPCCSCFLLDAQPVISCSCTAKVEATGRHRWGVARVRLKHVG